MVAAVFSTTFLALEEVGVPVVVGGSVVDGDEVGLTVVTGFSMVKETDFAFMSSEGG